MTSGGLEIVGLLAIDLPFATYSPSTSEGEIPRQLNNCLHHFILFHKKMHEVERFVIWKTPSLISLSHLSKFVFIQISGCRDSYNLSKGQFDNIDYKTLKVDIPFVAPRAAPNDAGHLLFIPLCSPLSQWIMAGRLHLASNGCWKNHYRSSGLKQHRIIILELWTSEVQNGLLWTNTKVSTVNSKAESVSFLSSRGCPHSLVHSPLPASNPISSTSASVDTSPSLTLIFLPPCFTHRTLVITLDPTR